MLTLVFVQEKEGRQRAAKRFLRLSFSTILFFLFFFCLLVLRLFRLKSRDSNITFDGLLQQYRTGFNRFDFCIQSLFIICNSFLCKDVALLLLFYLFIFYLNVYALMFRWHEGAWSRCQWSAAASFIKCVSLSPFFLRNVPSSSSLGVLFISTLVLE